MQRRDIPIEKLTIDRVQSRDTPWVGDETDKRLADSVASTGLLHDVIVRPPDSAKTDEGADRKHAIIAGSRRYYAALEAGYEQLPCKVIEADDLEAAWTSLTENTDRRDLSEQELAHQLKLIYEMVRPLEPPTTCPDCGQSVDGEAGLRSHRQQTGCTLPQDPQAVATDVDVDPPADASAVTRFTTKQQALTYIAARYFSRTDDDALDLVAGHLRTAELPPVVQALFKLPEERTDEERMAINNYGISASTRLGSGDGRSGTARDVASLYDTLADELDEETALTPTGAVLKTVGSLTFEEMSEQELRQNIREFRREVSAELTAHPENQHEAFTETLARQATGLREMYEKVEPTRPFKKVDVMGPETQRYSRWHVQAMQARGVDAHSALVKQLYQERLKRLAEEHGWG
jgi:hypothetical protein